MLCPISSSLLRQLNQQMEGWADEFGGDYEQTIMGKRVVFVTGVEDIRRILLLRPAKFKRGWTAVSSCASSSSAVRVCPAKMIMCRYGRAMCPDRSTLISGYNDWLHCTLHAHFSQYSILQVCSELCWLSQNLVTTRLGRVHGVRVVQVLAEVVS